MGTLRAARIPVGIVTLKSRQGPIAPKVFFFRKQHVMGFEYAPPSRRPVLRGLSPRATEAFRGPAARSTTARNRNKPEDKKHKQKHTRRNGQQSRRDQTEVES